MKNVFAATYAPMKEDLSLNPAVVKDYASFLVHNKITGVFINGSTGDFVSLSTRERKDLLKAWAKETSNDLYLINHVGHNNLLEAMELAEDSVGKADAVAAIAPFYFQLVNVENLVKYCKAIADKAPGLPFYYYHLPVLTGVNFSMVDFADMARKEIENFKGIKFTENNFVEFHKMNSSRKELDIFFGVDEAFLPSLVLQADGCVGSTYNHLVPLYDRIKEAFFQGDLDYAGKLQSMSIDFVEHLSEYGGFNGAGKSFMKKIGIDCGPSRFPHVTLTSEELEQSMNYFKKQGIADFFNKL